ncbi:hypothetical protein CWB96_00350 [Pseudoalteromonas citrea]|uniref:Uncharacterized protein n=1 Tax=Pseudoalteromonas citrea TaxID=43655 RepID=A0A5S3XVF7_9GAMM|nr:hypothetical protein [Pseudoalteromonas citrea]TMP46317.1 hypothetical protein CWB97_02345 [Pseudoalteromonas citrea]TMP63093.1 hypothetical protein CWB96_00350 [Pseudoalteromonas citrea]
MAAGAVRTQQKLGRVTLPLPYSLNNDKTPHNRRFNSTIMTSDIFIGPIVQSSDRVKANLNSPLNREKPIHSALISSQLPSNVGEIVNTDTIALEKTQAHDITHSLLKSIVTQLQAILAIKPEVSSTRNNSAIELMNNPLTQHVFNTQKLNSEQLSHVSKEVISACKKIKKTLINNEVTTEKLIKSYVNLIDNAQAGSHHKNTLQKTLAGLLSTATSSANIKANTNHYSTKADSYLIDIRALLSAQVESQKQHKQSTQKQQQIIRSRGSKPSLKESSSTSAPKTPGLKQEIAAAALGVFGLDDLAKYLFRQPTIQQGNTVNDHASSELCCCDTTLPSSIGIARSATQTSLPTLIEHVASKNGKDNLPFITSALTSPLNHIENPVKATQKEPFHHLQKPQLHTLKTQNTLKNQTDTHNLHSYKKQNIDSHTLSNRQLRSNPEAFSTDQHRLPTSQLTQSNHGYTHSLQSRRVTNKHDAQQVSYSQKIPSNSSFRTFQSTLPLGTGNRSSAKQEQITRTYLHVLKNEQAALKKIDKTLDHILDTTPHASASNDRMQRSKASRTQRVRHPKTKRSKFGRLLNVVKGSRHHAVSSANMKGKNTRKPLTHNQIGRSSTAVKAGITGVTSAFFNTQLNDISTSNLSTLPHHVQGRQPQNPVINKKTIRPTSTLSGLAAGVPSSQQARSVNTVKTDNNTTKQQFTSGQVPGVNRYSTPLNQPRSIVNKTPSRPTSPGNGALKGAGRMVLQSARILPYVGQALTAGLIISDGLNGWERAGENFNLSPNQTASTGQKIASSAGSVISGFTSGMFDEGTTARGLHTIGNAVSSIGSYIWDGFGLNSSNNIHAIHNPQLGEVTKKPQPAHHRQGVQNNNVFTPTIHTTRAPQVLQRAMKPTPLFPLQAAGMLAHDGFSGWQRSREHFSLTPLERPSIGQKLASATGSILSGLTFGMLNEGETARGITQFGNLFSSPPPDVTPGISSRTMLGPTKDIHTLSTSALKPRQLHSSVILSTLDQAMPTMVRPKHHGELNKSAIKSPESLIKNKHDSQFNNLITMTPSLSKKHKVAIHAPYNRVMTHAKKALIEHAQYTPSNSVNVSNPGLAGTTSNTVNASPLFDASLIRKNVSHSLQKSTINNQALSKIVRPNVSFSPQSASVTRSVSNSVQPLKNIASKVFSQTKVRPEKIGNMLANTLERVYNAPSSIINMDLLNKRVNSSSLAQQATSSDISTFGTLSGEPLMKGIPTNMLTAEADNKGSITTIDQPSHAPLRASRGSRVVTRPAKNSGTGPSNFSVDDTGIAIMNSMLFD